MTPQRTTSLDGTVLDDAHPTRLNNRLAAVEQRLAALEAAKPAAPDHTEGGRYRMLKVGDILHPEDEHMDPGVPNDSWEPCGISGNFLPTYGCLYRRPVAAAAQPVARETPREREDLRCALSDILAQCQEARRERDEARAELSKFKADTKEFLADPNRIHAHLLRNVPGWECWTTERVRWMERDLEAARAEVEQLKKQLATACSQVVAAREMADKARGYTNAIRAQLAAEREAGREEARVGIAEEFQGRANGMTPKSVLFYAEDIASYARTWKPAQEVKP